MPISRRLMVFAATLAMAALARGASWQTLQVQPSPTHHERPFTAWYVVPQARTSALVEGRPGGGDVAEGVRVESVRADVKIVDRTARTTLDIRLRNGSAVRAEAVLLMPMPPESVVSDFAFEGGAAEPTAEVLPADEARRLYEQIVASVRDPALLEFAGYNMLRSSVFPVEPHGTQRLRLSYESVLSGHGDRIDYFLPRSESLAADVAWDIRVEIEATSPIAMVYSPSHDLIEDRRGPRRTNLSIAPDSKDDPGHFLLSYLVQDEGMAASLFAYPDPQVGGGYFLLLAGAPPVAAARDHVPREVTIVLDRSGSMAGEKLDQATASALQIIEALQPDERFNIIDYATTVERFAPAPIARTEDSVREAQHYLKSLRAGGGTNIHDALVEALRQRPAEGALPLALFLTDGLPTVGRTSESDIRALVEKHNPAHRRVFTIGVGADVNVPLLDRVAEASRARSSYVLPGEDVEVKVAEAFARLRGPIFAWPALRTLDGNGRTSTRLVRDVIPASLPDVFDGDQVVVLGRYTHAGPITFELEGDYLGGRRAFRFTFDLDDATTRHAFVPRLWASRRIALLIDEIRQSTQAFGSLPLTTPTSLLDDPRHRELVEEIVRLSAEFGILSEYTSFLAREGTNLWDTGSLVVGCAEELNAKAVETRSGVAAVTQGLNVMTLKGRSKLAYDNAWINENLSNVTTTNVQQVNDLAFFKRGPQWIDGRIVAQGNEPEPDRIVEFGSPEHLALVRELIACHRQGSASLNGDVLLEHEGERILIRMSALDNQP